KGKIDFETLIPAVTKNPAQLMGIKNRGELVEGYFADVVVVAKEKRKIAAENFESKAKWTPFDGKEVLYTPKYVFVNGMQVKDDDYLISKANSGEILERKYNVKIPDKKIANEE
ncbi:MAG: amidohydrolase family protein, partial [Asgard group archaeon]|nr:amidohydrolase family protein [Asgard group archaeon]